MTEDDEWLAYIKTRNFDAIKDASTRWNCVKLNMPRRMFSLPLPKRPRIIPMSLRKLVETEITYLILFGHGPARTTNLFEALGFALVLNDDTLAGTIVLALAPCPTMNMWKAPDWDTMPACIREAFIKVQGDDISNVYDLLVSNRKQKDVADELLLVDQ